MAALGPARISFGATFSSYTNATPSVGRSVVDLMYLDSLGMWLHARNVQNFRKRRTGLRFGSIEFPASIGDSRRVHEADTIVKYKRMTKKNE